MNVSLPAVIVGCGPSAVRVPYAPDRYTVHAVNDAIRLCERADVLAINDTPALMRLTAEDIDKVDLFVLPAYLHDDPKPSGLTAASDAFDILLGKLGHDWSRAPECDVYVLHTDPRGVAPTFGRCRSTSDSLIAYLLSQGFRSFRTLGIEWDGRDGSHPDLPPGMNKTAAHRRSIWQHTLARIQQTGATVQQGLPE